jgi:acetolactate synthase-1/2/3 large subunit
VLVGLVGCRNVIAMIKESDLIIVVGARIGEMTSQGYSLLDIPGGAGSTRPALVHVHPSGDELNSVYTAALPIQSTPLAFFEAVVQLPAPPALPWSEWTAAGHASFLK